jgi:Kdo2-lipid IVA lauroyltransferase/acyltransferase
VIIDIFLVFLLKSFQQFLRILPEKGEHAVGVRLGRTAFRLLKGRRNIAIANIKRVFREIEDREAALLAKRCFEKLGINFIEVLLVPYLDKGLYAQRFSLENRECLESALKLGRGIIALCFHYGNWELMGVVSWFLQRDVVALARPLKGRVLVNGFLNRVRSSTGLTIIPNANTGRDVIGYLKANKIVAILGDQREKRSAAVYVDLFGEKVPTSRGIATIGMKTGAPVIPVHAVREGFLRYRIVLSEPLRMEREGNIGQLVEKNTRKINAALEAVILENPDEWFWVHRRWGRKSQ